MFERKINERGVSPVQKDKMREEIEAQNIRQDRFSSSYLEFPNGYDYANTTKHHITILTKDNFVIQFSLQQQRELWRVQLPERTINNFWMRVMKDGQVLVLNFFGGKRELFIIKNGLIICDMNPEDLPVQHLKSTEAGYLLNEGDGDQFLVINEGKLTFQGHANLSTWADWKRVSVTSHKELYSLFFKDGHPPTLARKAGHDFKVASEILPLENAKVIKVILSNNLLWCVYKKRGIDTINVLTWDLNTNTSMHDFALDLTYIHEQKVKASEQFLVYATENETSEKTELYAIDLKQQKVTLLKSLDGDIFMRNVNVSINNTVCTLMYQTFRPGDETCDTTRVIIDLETGEELYEVKYQHPDMAILHSYSCSFVIQDKKFIYIENWNASNEWHLDHPQKGIKREVSTLNVEYSPGGMAP